MAIAVNGGHVSRAMDFYNSVGKYFIIGGTIPWEDETAPPAPTVEDYKLVNVVGLKKVDNAYLVIPTDETTNVISYRNQNWKKLLSPIVRTTVGTTGVTSGATVVPVTSIEGLTVGSKIRVANIYEGKIVSISGLLLTLDTPSPSAIAAGSTVEAGAFVEGAKYVYVECYLEYDSFPIQDTSGNPLTYRQIGLCTGVLPNTIDVLRSAAYNNLSNQDEYTSLGTLEILDNRAPSTRDINQRELLSLIVEF